jgi:hypothetical protein
MAERKISEFPSFVGAPDSSTYFIVASGEANNPASKNYRFDFKTLSEQINLSLHGDFETPISVSGDGFLFAGIDDESNKPLYFASSDTLQASFTPSSGIHIHDNIHSDSHISTSNTISGARGHFEEYIHISDNPVLTGFDFSNNGDQALDGNEFNINIGGESASTAKNINFNIKGDSKIIIKDTGGIYISDDTYFHKHCSFGTHSTFSGLTIIHDLELHGPSKFTDHAIFHSGIHLPQFTEEPEDSTEHFYNFNGDLKWGDQNVVTEDLLSESLLNLVDNDTLDETLERNYLSKSSFYELYNADGSVFSGDQYLPGNNTIGTKSKIDIIFENSGTVTISSISHQLFNSIEFIEDNNINSVSMGAEEGDIKVYFIPNVSTFSELQDAVIESFEGILSVTFSFDPTNVLITQTTALLFEGNSTTNLFGRVLLDDDLEINGNILIKGETISAKFTSMQNTITTLQSQITALQLELQNVRSDLDAIS